MSSSKQRRADSAVSKKVSVGAIVLLALAGTALAAVYLWPAGPPPKIAELQQQMLSAEANQLTERQKERIQDQLIREVDQLDASQRREVWDGVRDQFRQRVRSGVERFDGLPESERASFLDTELPELQRWRYTLYTMRPQEPYVPRRFRKSEQEAIAKEKALAEENAAAEDQKSTPADAQRERRANRGADRGAQDRPEGRRSRRSDRGGRGDGRRRSRGWVEPEEGMEVQYAAYWKAIYERRRELWAERRGPQERSSRDRERASGSTGARR